MNFQDILDLYAKYNKQANAEMLRILGTIPESRLNEVAGTYYKTLGGLLNHGLRSSAGSLKRAADGGLLPDLILPVVGAFPQVPMGETIFATLAEYSGLRTEVDELLVAVCAKAAPADLDKTFSFIGYDKQQKTMSYGGILLALYTHETHHRGGVSTILDGWGVANDWSSLMKHLLL
jgi:uncharacterized damage-inducible protein DinB